MLQSFVCNYSVTSAEGHWFRSTTHTTGMRKLIPAASVIFLLFSVIVWTSDSYETKQFNFYHHLSLLYRQRIQYVVHFHTCSLEQLTST